MRFLFLCLLQVTSVSGHGQLDEQIADATSRIVATPNDPQLWLHRADLHQSHRDPAAALQDLRQATQIEPPYPPAFLKLARFHRKSNQPALATKTLATYFKLQSNPTPQAHREKALISSPKDALGPWRFFLTTAEAPAMSDFALAAQAALDAEDDEVTHEFLLTGLNRHPKSIPLHQIHARNSLARNNSHSARSTFKTLRLLYPNLLVKLNYEESLIWEQNQEPALARQALQAALKAFHQLPPRLQKNRDLQNLVAKIKDNLPK